MPRGSKDFSMSLKFDPNSERSSHPGHALESARVPHNALRHDLAHVTNL